MNIVYNRKDSENTLAIVSLAGVMSISEVAQRWGKSIAAVRYHVNRGSFASRSSGGVILVSTRSVTLIWGQPSKGWE